MGPSNRMYPRDIREQGAQFVNFCYQFLVPVGLFDYFALLEAGSLRKDQRDSLYNYSCYDLILFVVTLLK